MPEEVWVGESLLSNAAKGNIQGDLSKQMC